MAHDVFISYAHTDKPTGDAVCATLEARGIRCWMAPRDVLPGVIYSGAIVEAIHASRVFVLVFSAEANISPHVMRELERAVNDGIPVLPLRIEDVPLSPSMEYFISTPHWLDALTPPLEKHLIQLAETVKLLLQRADAEAEAKRPAAAPPSPPPSVADTLSSSVAEPPSFESSNPSPAPVPMAAPARAAAGPPPAPVELPPIAPVQDAPVRAEPLTRMPGAVPVRGLPRWAVGGAAALVVVIAVGLVLSSGAGGGIAAASPTPFGSATGSPGAATLTPGPSPSVAGATPDTTGPAWAATGRMTVARIAHTATWLEDGRILVAGGYRDVYETAVASAELYDPATGRWTATASMTEPRAQHLSVALENGNVLVVGGKHEIVPGEGETAELYDPEAGTWKATGGTHGIHLGGTLTLLRSNEVLLAGGDEGDPASDSEIYNPKTGKWRDAGAMRVVRTGHTATRLADGRVLVVGGARPQDSPASPAALTTCEIYDPGTGMWTATGNLASARTGHAAIRLGDGRVLVLGGSLHGPAIEGEAALATAEVYDPETGKWSAAGSLQVGRERFTATPTDAGIVVVAGGSDGFGLILESEILDPATGRSDLIAAAAQMWSRSDHTATLLGDGQRVLVAGGFNIVALNVADVFDPGD